MALNLSIKRGGRAAQTRHPQNPVWLTAGEFFWVGCQHPATSSNIQQHSAHSFVKSVIYADFS
jgi:hypothetical protein